MNMKYAALASTALITLSAIPALANGNDVYLIQDGGNNQALINQEGAIDSALGNGALIAQQIGVETNPVVIAQIEDQPTRSYIHFRKSILGNRCI